MLRRRLYPNSYSDVIIFKVMEGGLRFGKERMTMFGQEPEEGKVIPVVPTRIPPPSPQGPFGIPMPLAIAIGLGGLGILAWALSSGGPGRLSNIDEDYDDEDDEDYEDDDEEGDESDDLDDADDTEEDDRDEEFDDDGGDVDEDED
jgi:hypothetical protein